MLVNSGMSWVWGVLDQRSLFSFFFSKLKRKTAKSLFFANAPGRLKFRKREIFPLLSFAIKDLQLLTWKLFKVWRKWHDFVLGRNEMKLSITESQREWIPFSCHVFRVPDFLSTKSQKKFLISFVQNGLGSEFRCASTVIRTHELQDVSYAHVWCCSWGNLLVTVMQLKISRKVKKDSLNSKFCWNFGPLTISWTCLNSGEESNHWFCGRGRCQGGAKHWSILRVRQ